MIKWAVSDDRAQNDYLGFNISQDPTLKSGPGYFNSLSSHAVVSSIRFLATESKRDFHEFHIKFIFLLKKL